MKILLTALLACLIGTSFAAISSTSQQTKVLGSVWKNYQQTTPVFDKHDITMGYGGADVLRKLPNTALTVLA